WRAGFYTYPLLDNAGYDSADQGTVALSVGSSRGRVLGDLNAANPARDRPFRAVLTAPNGEGGLVPSAYSVPQCNSGPEHIHEAMRRVLACGLVLPTQATVPRTHRTSATRTTGLIVTLYDTISREPNSLLRVPFVRRHQPHELLVPAVRLVRIARQQEVERLDA